VPISCVINKDRRTIRVARVALDRALFTILYIFSNRSQFIGSMFKFTEQEFKHLFGKNRVKVRVTVIVREEIRLEFYWFFATT
jgi:hypothetical protein